PRPGRRIWRRWAASPAATGPTRTLGPHEPGQPDQRHRDRYVEVQPQAEVVVGRVDPQRLLEDPEGRISGHVQGEEARRADLPPLAEPDQRSCEREVPDDLVEEGRLERRVLEVPGRTVDRVDLQAPRKARRPAEQLLVEVVAD